MRSIVLAFLLLQLGWAPPAYAQGASPMAGMLPLFAKNNCASLKETAEQLFCGDLDLNALAPRLGAAVEARLSRIVDRRQAAEENVEWIESRNASCGIFGVQPIQPAAFAAVTHTFSKPGYHACADVALRLGCHLRISFGEMKAGRIFPFCISCRAFH